MEYVADDIISRIQDIYNSCTHEEKSYLYQILQEFADTGDSKTYNDVWLADYIEIPVTIHTFISSDMFLGKVTRQGEGVYPYWKKVLSDIFSAGNQYDECIFTGATRIGKTSTAITAASYMLYRLMCLRNPQQFFGIKDESKISILFFNITKDLAKGVAFREFNDTLKASPWFNQHGTFSKSDQNFYYIPDGGKVTIDYGSDSAHALGKQVYCVVGNTLVYTDRGWRQISDIVGTQQNIYQYNMCTGAEELSTADVSLTAYTHDTIRITLEDGSMFEGTPDHKVLLTDGTYKCLKDLQNCDDVLTLNTYDTRNT